MSFAYPRPIASRQYPTRALDIVSFFRTNLHVVSTAREKNHHGEHQHDTSCEDGSPSFCSTVVARHTLVLRYSERDRFRLLASYTVASMSLFSTLRINMQRQQEVCNERQSHRVPAKVTDFKIIKHE